MLSPFPELFVFSWYVPLFLRLFLAIYLLRLGYRLANQGDATGAEDRFAFAVFGGLLIVLSFSFLLGLYVQIAGVIGFVLALFAQWIKNAPAGKAPESRAFYFLIGLVSLSLVFLGTGPFAFDLPL